MQTITFGDQTIGATNPTYDLKDNSVSFTGLIGTDPLDLGAGSALTGLILDPISWTFSQPVSQVSFDADVLGLSGSTTVTYYDQSGNVLDSVTNTTLGDQTFSYSNPDIARVEIQSNSLSGFTVDNVAFADTTSLFSSVANPASNPLIEGFKWGADALTYSMPTADTEYTAGGYTAVTGFAALSSTDTSEIQQLMANVSAVSGLTMTQTTGTGADLRFAQATSIDSDDGSGAQTITGSTVFAPGAGASSVSAGDTWVQAGTTPTDVALMQDVGQALGLQMETVSGTHDSIAYSVMSSDIYPGGSPSDLSAVDAPSTLMQDDIAALQAIYGANYGVNSGNTVYTWNPTTGEESINGVGQGAPADGKVFMTLWDGGGNDTLDFSAYTDAVSIDLKPGHWTTIGSVADLGDGNSAPGNIAMAQLYQDNPQSLIENANGGSGNDFIEGNAANNTIMGNAGNDNLHGSSGNDILDGGAGADYLVGGLGDDTYVYGAASDSTSTQFDTVRTFSVLHDKFDLWFQVTGIDQTVDGALDIGAFDSDLAAATSNLQAHHAELFHATSGSFAGDTFLVIDANGQAGYQAGSDLVIRLDHINNVADISASDFVTS